MAGFVGWGDKQSGFFGITQGPYAFQHAEITPWWQLVGIGATVGITAIAVIVILGVLEKTVGLRAGRPRRGDRLRSEVLDGDAGLPGAHRRGGRHGHRDRAGEGRALTAHIA